MATKAKDGLDTLLTVAQCAEHLSVSSDRIVKWIEGGHLAAFCPPGKGIADGQRGPKTLRIFKEDWEAFLRSRVMTGSERPASTVVTIPANAIRRPVPTGSDGIVRSRRKSKRPD